MKAKSENPLKEQIPELLLKEYESLLRLIMNEDQECEKRVTFFLTLAGGGILIMGYLSKQQQGLYPTELYYGILGLLIILHLFGLSGFTVLEWKKYKDSSLAVMKL